VRGGRARVGTVPKTFAGSASLLLALIPLAACEEARSRPATGDGDRASMVGALVYEHKVDGNQDLYVIPVTGGEPRRLTTHPATDGLPRWTADGQAVIFTSDRSGNWQVWRVSATDGEPTRVRTNSHREWQADESPDGRRFAFLSNRDGSEFLFLMEAATVTARALVRHGRRTIMGNPHWSPGGERIVFSSNWRSGHQIYVVEVKTGKEKRISPIGGCEPRFSPDGKRVVYVGRRVGRKDRSRIMEHDLSTGEERPLVEWPALNYDPVYSPDGSELAFASNITGEWAIYRQRLADGKSHRVTFAKGPARYPDYSPIPRLRER
jgi:Tol biopolymer transport system component